MLKGAAKMNGKSLPGDEEVHYMYGKVHTETVYTVQAVMVVPTLKMFSQVL